NTPGNKETRWLTLTLVTIAAIAAAIGLAFGFVAVYSIGERSAHSSPVTATALPPTAAPTVPVTTAPETTPTIPPTSTSLPPTPTAQPPFFEGPFTYGASFGGRPLTAYRLGAGHSVRAIIGGIHGGYEWNTVDLVSQTLEYLQENPTLVPDDVTLYIIPCANPDGYAAGADREHGRMNGNGVDLNRNWDYNWQMTATHGTRPVFAGSGPFSEPETDALRDLILEQNVEAAIFYHSAMAKVFYGAEREKSATYELAVTVSEATGYPIAASIPGQITTGDAVDWMSAEEGLAGVEVELTNHEDIEWERNLRGLLAFLDWQPPSEAERVVQTTQIGNSVQGRPIEATQVGDGNQVTLVIIGAIHGDEANTETLVRGLMEQYTGAPVLVPPNFTLYFVPAMNPDGLTTSTRQNANQVDLNRNWPTGDWQADAARTSGIVPGSGGAGPGSEPEVQAVRQWLLKTVQPSAQEVWLLSYHSAYPPDGGVQPGYTTYGVPGPQADELARRVADLTGYTYLPTWPSEHTFTGELIHWCDVNGIWAADVELPNHDPPDETTLATHRRVLSALLEGSADGYIHYTVKPGDSLLAIAIQFDVTVEQIKYLNGIGDEDYIVEGKVLLIPTGGQP
ncbi:MAG: M14 family zinc carboxypeptidase, partial [Chloroflexota bacterium]|nr:M14 family zinc carboxypeptidase [Chloroflexota bacterium]